MEHLLESFKHATGKTLKSAKFDSKTSIVTLNFEGGGLNNTVSFTVKSNAFVNFSASPPSSKNPRLKAKEKALEPVEFSLKKPKNKKQGKSEST